MTHSELRRRADAGDAAACNQLGMLLLQEAPSPPNDVRTGQLADALKYFEQSAKLGDPEGMWNAGWRYWLGEGTPKDELKAVLLWQRAAMRGHRNASDYISNLRTQLLTKVDPQTLAKLKAHVAETQTYKFIFLLTGRGGVGKTTTIRKFLGKAIGKVDAFRPATTGVDMYEDELNGIPFQIIDTPGLGDAHPEASNDQTYLDAIRETVPMFHCAWFVTRLNDARLDGSEMVTIELISKSLGSDIWKHGIIVFTHADKVDAADFAITLEERTKLVREQITRYVGPEIGNSVPAVAVGNELQLTLPDGKNWLAELFMAVWRRIDKLDQLGLLSGVLFEDINKPEEGLRIPLSEAQLATVKRDVEQAGGAITGVGAVATLGYLGIGAAAGGAVLIGGPIGAAVGVVAFAAFLIWGRD